MRKTVNRRFGIVFGAAVAVVAVASAAWACAAYTPLILNSSKGRPGKVVTGTGYNFTSNAETFSGVEIRLGSRGGQLLDSGAVNPDGTFDVEFTVPSVKRGWYTILATQYRLSDGAPKSGSPGRAAFKVRPALSSSAALPVGGPSAGSRDSGGPVVLTATKAAPGLESFAAIVALAALAALALGGAYWNRTRKVAAPQTA